ncbi:nSTAND1 domain-containing NTPase [Microcoleus sp. B9-D4]|uniref:nSTAND1 domain-containing NTPase n=1 Tax=Microcoleus sp. B9-D4 TaxID=2818711 RepID=UPI002FCEB6F1
MKAFEFEITIQSKSGDYSWPIVLRCKPLDELTTHSSGILQLSKDDFTKLTQEQENEKAYGIILGKALFRENVRDTFVRALSKSSQDCPLRILLSIEVADDDEVRRLHWERLCAPIDSDDSWQLLARDQRVPFSRYIPSPIDRRFPPIGRRDLRALVLVASPANIGKFQLAPFDVEAVVSRVKEALGEIHSEILANNVAGAIGPPTLQELSKQLTNAKNPYTLLHFVCHGKLIDNGETVLYWAQADNQVLPVTGTELLDELRNIGGRRGLPHFAFLCTCESADPRAEGALGGLAQRLVRELGMPAVIAMTRKVSVETGLALGQSFYRRLRESGEVDTALQEATAGLGNRHDITVPALFSRLGGRPLFSDSLENRELTDEEIGNGIRKLRELLDERAPVLQQRFETQVEKLNNTRGADSQAAREERHQALKELNNLCVQILELSFDALAALDKKPPPYQAECPFPGLSSFRDEKYHKFFFGRDELIKELKQKLESDNFLAVSGISGSGKSSVVLAGLIPKLKEQEPSLQCNRITPSNEPLKQLEEILLNVSEQPSVLVVDQFEELFTLCENKDNRQEFITRLLNLASHRKVVVTMRVDFLAECTFYPELSKRIETRQKLVGPMQPAELITAMKMQADKAGLRFEAGLSDSILNDVKKEAGAMPLLQYALQELWKRRHGVWLCHEEYQAIGRVEQAIAKTADDFYNSLPASEREQVRNIFLRLTRMDVNAVEGKNTGRRVELEDLVSAGSDLAVTKKLVQQLAGEKARLVVTSRNEATEKDEVEVAHEALISYWPKLQNWLNENRNDLLLRQDINDAAEKWQQHQEQLDKDSYLTHKGGRLEDAEKLLKEPKLVHLNPLEADYVKACVELRDRQEREKEEQRQRELYQEKKATKAAQTRNRIATISAVGLAGLAIFALWQWGQTTRQIKITELQRNIALVKNILSTEPTKALTLAITTTKQSSTEFDRQFLGPAESALFSTLDAAREQKVFRGHKGAVTSVAFSLDGQMIASTGQDGKIRLWKLDGTIKKVINNQAPAIAVVFNPKDKNILASLNKNGTLKIWDLRDYKVKFRISSNRSTNVTSVAFNPQDRYVFVTGGQDGKVQLWNLKNKTSKIIGTRKSAVYATAFSSDGKTIAVGGAGKNIQLWNLDGKNTAPKELLAGDKGEVDSSGYGCITTIKFDYDKYSTTLVNGERMGSFALHSKLHIWPIYEGSNSTGNSISAHNFSIYSMDVSQNGAIVSSGDDGTIQLHDLKGKLLTKQPLIGHEIKNDFVGQDCRGNSGFDGSVAAVAFRPDGQTIVSGGSDGTVRLWSAEALPGLKLVPVKTVGLLQDRSNSPIYENFPKTLKFFRSNGSQIEMINKRDTVEWKDINDTNFQHQSQTRSQKELYFYSPDGERIATVTQGNFVEVRDQQEKLLEKPFDVAVKVKLGALNSNSRRIVLVDRENGIQVRDFTGNRIGNSFRHEGEVSDIAISPDGQKIVTASSVGVAAEGISSSTLRLWDIHGNLITKFDLSNALFGRESYTEQNSLLAFSPSGKSMIAYSRLITSSVMTTLPSNSQVLLEAACNRLRYHPILNNPTTLNLNKNEIEVSRQAKDICQKDVWNNQPMQ